MPEMTMTTMERRIEIMARQRLAIGEMWTSMMRYDRDRHLARARNDLRAAFPELFDGTAWLAPMEPTPEMIRKGEGMTMPALRFKAMRDAHLISPPSSSSTSSTQPEPEAP
jgi:hypothetical protein